MRHSGLDATSFFFLMLAASIAAVVTRRLRIPYAVGLVVIGVLLGLTHLLPTVRLDPHVLFTVFLPPLLFESSINLRADALRREWKAILLLAVVVTLLSCVITGYLASWFFGLPIASALVFGALIAATDPISVIAVFKQLGANRRLTLLLDAEALFNDGIAVVLFTVLLAAAGGGRVTILGGVLSFVGNAVGGSVVGAVIGYIGARVTRLLDDHLLEITLTTVVAFGAYLGADALHVSGVLAVIAAGLVVGNYGMPTSMSPATRLAVADFWEYAAFAVNSLVFLIVGIEVTRGIDDSGDSGLFTKILLFLGSGLIVLAGRLSLYAVAFVANRFGVEIPVRSRHVLVWGALRGALSMALALGLAPDFPGRETIVSMTFGAVAFSLLVQGPTIRPLLNTLGLVGESSVDLDPITTDS